MPDATLPAGSANAQNPIIRKQLHTVPGQPTQRTANITWTLSDGPYTGFEVALYYRANDSEHYGFVASATAGAGATSVNVGPFLLQPTVSGEGTYPKYAVKVTGFKIGESPAYIIEDIIKL
jgi:hypothetical protein